MERIEQTVEVYLARLYRLRSTGGATAETSFYSALEELLNAIGHDLKPKVFCLSQLADQGAGQPILVSSPLRNVRGGNQGRAFSRSAGWSRWRRLPTTPGLPRKA